jgi:hypothetical protein
MPRALCLVLLTVVAALANGCCHLASSAHPRPAQPVPAALTEAVSYTKPDGLAYTVTDLETNGHYGLQRIEMAAAAHQVWTNRTLLLDYYRPAGPPVLQIPRMPVILVLPIIGGGYPLERMFCEYFARHGLAAVLVRRDRLRTPDQLDQINGMLLQAAIDSRQALDWVETRPELDARAIGVFGVSMGGIRAAFLTPLDPRIRASVIGLAGGDLPHILTYSCEPGLSRRRRAYMKSHQLTLEEFHEGLKPVMTSDPLRVAPCIDPSKVLLVLAACDTAVPTKKGFELRKAMGKPETIVVPTGHYTALLYVPYIKAACLRFFHEKLRTEPPHAIADKRAGSGP